MMKKLGLLAYVVVTCAASARADQGNNSALLSALKAIGSEGLNIEAPKLPPGVPVAAAAAAAPTIFTGGSSWESNSGRGFSPLKVLGIQGDAENNALAKCQAAGFLNCVITGSQITSCNSYTCGASATARDLEVVPGAQFETVNESSRWTTNNQFSTLERTGVLKSARDKARAACQQKGLLDCVVIGGAIDSCNDDYECRATATARGRK